MSYSKSKSTKRFTFSVDRNATAKKAGANTLNISTSSTDGKYSTSQASLTMTIKEAQVLQNFLNESLVNV